MWVNLLVKALLFMLLVPGVHIRIPPGGTLLEQAVIHSLYFTVTYYFIYIYILPLLERFENNPDTKKDAPCPTGSVKGKNGECRIATDIHGPFA
jgi:hypothetical protein